MADTKISALPVTTTSAAADSIPIVQGGVTKRIHPGPAGGFDANTVSGYGIGTLIASTETDLNNYKTGGKYLTPDVSGMTHVPTNFTSERLFVEVIGAGSSGSYVLQIITGAVVRQQILRIFYVTTWYEDIFGNAGQPPAPKPQVGGAGPGYIQQAVYSAPDTVAPAGGTWMYWYAYGANGLATGIRAGGAVIVAGGDVSVSCACYRIT
jgi:hypothetical protein